MQIRLPRRSQVDRSNRLQRQMKTERLRCLESHVAAFWPGRRADDPTWNLVRLAASLPDFRVRRLTPRTEDDHWIYATIGASEASVGARREAILLSTTETPRHVETHAMVAYYEVKMAGDWVKIAIDRLNSLMAEHKHEPIHSQNVAFVRDSDVTYATSSYSVPRSSIIAYGRVRSTFAKELSGGPGWIHCNLLRGVPEGYLITIAFGGAVGNDNPPVNVSCQLSLISMIT